MIKKYVYGDAIAIAKERDYDVIAHGCNCFCTQTYKNAGFAKLMSDNFHSHLLPIEKDIEKKGDYKKLGKIDLAWWSFKGNRLILPEEHISLEKEGNELVQKDNGILICNMYTQYGYGRLYKNPSKDGQRTQHLNEMALSNCFEKLNRLMPTGTKVLIPKIGAGLAGGDWKRIKVYIDVLTPDLDITVVNYKPQKKKRYVSRTKYS